MGKLISYNQFKEQMDTSFARVATPQQLRIIKAQLESYSTDALLVRFRWVKHLRSPTLSEQVECALARRILLSRVR